MPNSGHTSLLSLFSALFSNSKCLQKINTKNFTFRIMKENYGESWVGIRRDENYTYFADGTKERSTETTVVWNEAYRPSHQCASSSRRFIYMIQAVPCVKELMAAGICEKSVCKN